jgi:hypothetical protein
MTKLILNSKPVNLQGGDRVIYRKVDSTLTISRGSAHMRFQKSGDHQSRGDSNILLGRIENPQAFLTGLMSLISAITGLDARKIETTGDAYLSFELVDLSKGETE